MEVASPNSVKRMITIETIGPIVQNMTAKGLGPDARAENAKPLYQILTNVNDGLDQIEGQMETQAKRIDELVEQVRTLEEAATKPNPDLEAATKELAVLKASSAEEKRALEEQLEELREQLAAKGEIKDQSEGVEQLTAQIEKLERQNAEMGEQHAAAIEVLEKRVAALDLEAKKVTPLQEELAALRKTAAQVEDLTAQLDQATEGQRREATKAADVQAKFDITTRVGSMNLVAIQDRLLELGETDVDTIEAFEKGVLERQQKTILSAVDAKARELEEVAEKRRAEVEAQQMVVAQQRMLEQMQRQIEQDARLLQTPVQDIPDAIRALQEKVLNPALEGLRQIEAGEQEDLTGAVKLAHLEAKVNAEHKIVMLETLQRFHEVSKEVLLQGLEQQLAQLSDALRVEGEVLRKLENPDGETPKDESAIEAQRQKLRQMEAELERLKELQEAQGAVVATDMIAAGNAFGQLVTLLKDDMKGMSPFEALKQMVEVLDDIRAHNLIYSGEDLVPVANVKERLLGIIKRHNTLNKIVGDVVEKLQLKGVGNLEALPQIQVALLKLQAAADRVPQLTVDKTQLEWEKGVLGTMQRIVWNFFAMIFGIPGFILGGIQGAGSIIVSKK